MNTCRSLGRRAATPSKTAPPRPRLRPPLPTLRPSGSWRARPATRKSPDTGPRQLNSRFMYMLCLHKFYQVSLRSQDLNDVCAARKGFWTPSPLLSVLHATYPSVGTLSEGTRSGPEWSLLARVFPSAAGWRGARPRGPPSRRPAPTASGGGCENARV